MKLNWEYVPEDESLLARGQDDLWRYVIMPGTVSCTLVCCTNKIIWSVSCLDLESAKRVAQEHIDNAFKQVAECPNLADTGKVLFESVHCDPFT